MPAKVIEHQFEKREILRKSKICPETALTESRDRIVSSERPAKVVGKSSNGKYRITWRPF